ncbi:thioredoxin family protein [Legionella antarctica]|uniref:Thioredoxin family protein n=1 Tax=Legionella antarctica TaxID=2708020 RepID=A0A6F8T5R3_9GAMM|nr:thioredoxin family protein [Legionella antarctica]BCA95490.1 thioredoxin family protein [Legionella antarctica]
MSKTASNMLPLGTIAPDFELKDVTTGNRIKLNDSTDYIATVIMFICNHCPYVKHLNANLTQLANEYSSKNIRFLAINSNDVESYPDDSPENMRITAKSEHYPFPYLYDETQEVAKAYNAACTPDFYVFDTKLCLVYRGQFDDSRPGNNIPVSGDSIRKALDCLISPCNLDFEQKPSLGCNIKWK